MLSVRDVAVSRGGVPVVAGVTFDVPAGTALVLRGPNGIGKTTLLRTLAGLQPATAGHIGIAPDAVAYAGHADGIKATLSVAENLSFWARIFGQSDIGAALRAFDLSGLEPRLAGSLSAGQKRRLGLARLLVTGRPVWVLDEPTVSLDTASVSLFAGAVRDHCDDGGVALIATHVDLGLETAAILDLTDYRVSADAALRDDTFGDAFL